MNKVAGVLNAKEQLDKIFKKMISQANMGNSITLNLRFGTLVIAKGSFDFR